MTEFGTPSMRGRAEGIAKLADELSGAANRRDWYATERLARDLLSAVSKVLQRAQVMLELAGENP